MEVIERHLKTFLDSRLDAHTGSKKLNESIRYSVLNPGKRLRPKLLIESGRLFDFPEISLLPAACAVELYHCFTLIHDDLPILDDDDERRGKPSNHKVFGDAIALLAGDGLFSLAYESFLETSQHFPAERVSKAFGRFLEATGPRGVIGGQAMEVELGENPGSTETLARIHALKTGTLFETSVLVPMDLVDSKDLRPENKLALEDFAKLFGSCFQIADDVEDLKQDQNAEKNAFSNGESMEWARGQLQQLQDATARLQKTFGKTSTGIASIGDQLSEKLQKLLA